MWRWREWSITKFFIRRTRECSYYGGREFYDDAGVGNLKIVTASGPFLVLCRAFFAYSISEWRRL